MKNNIVTRFAPSPTGLLHAGNYRTAIFSYLYAKHLGGTFILRIEDTDKARSKKEYEDNIIDALAWLGLEYDAHYRQSENAPRHRALLEKLIAEDKAYLSKETQKQEGDRAEVIRFRNPGGVVSFEDLIRGTISVDVSDLSDFVIARSLDEPIFHFAVVVDDADEGVTHVVRGEDHISNTPRQILIHRALGFPIPMYAHLPLILNNDRTKLSKRNGAKAITEYRALGYLPEALLNYLAFLGWNPGDDREYLAKDELISSFDLARVQKGSAIFDEVKLASINQHWMRKLSYREFIGRGNFSAHADTGILEKIFPLLKDRAHTFGEVAGLLNTEFKCFFEAPIPAREILLAKAGTRPPEFTKTALEGLLEPLNGLPESVSPEAVKELIMPLADAEEARGKGGRGAVLWPFRYALSGQEKSPDPFTLVSILGKDESTQRIKKAIAILEE